MRRSLITLLLCGALATVGISENLDISGWNKAKWGMTQEQVVRELPEATIHPPDQYSLKPFLAIDQYSIGARKYAIKFAFDEAGELFRVEILPEHKCSSCLREGGVAAEAAQSELLDLLKDKYGKASNSSTEKDGNATHHLWEWIRTQGRIDLSYYEYPDWRSSFMSLVYYRRKESKAV